MTQFKDRVTPPTLNIDSDNIFQDLTSFNAWIALGNTTGGTSANPVPVWIGGVLYTDNGSTLSIAKSRSVQRTPQIGLIIGDSIASNHNLKYNVTGYSFSGGTCTLTVSTDPSAVVTAGSLIFVSGNLPSGIKDKRFLTTAVTSTTISFAATGSGSGTTYLGTATVSCIFNASGSTGIGIGRSPRGFIHVANALLGGPIIIPASYNYGIDGATYVGKSIIGSSPSGLVDRIDTVLANLPVKPDIAFNICGTNDINYICTGGCTLAQLQTAADYCWKAQIANGILPVVILPNSAAGSMNANYNKALASFREFVNSYARQYKSIVVVDAQNHFTDPLSATGAPLSGYTDDNIHPNPKGALALAFAVADQLKPYTSQYSMKPNGQIDAYDATYAPSGDLINGVAASKGYGLFATTVTNTAVNSTGSQVLAGYAVQRDGGTGTISLAVSARTDTFADAPAITIPGNEMVISFANTVAGTNYVNVNFQPAQWFTAAISAGDRLIMEAEWEWTGLSACTEIRHPLVATQFQDGDGKAIQMATMFSTAESTLPIAHKLTCKTAAVPVSGAMSYATIIMQIQAPTCTAAVLRIKHFSVRKDQIGLPY